MLVNVNFFLSRIVSLEIVKTVQDYVKNVCVGSVLSEQTYAGTRVQMDVFEAHQQIEFINLVKML